jgi:predicted transposase YbfD/YdcC
VCAVIGGADGWTDVEDFGNAKEEWLGSFLELPNCIPSHDTFGRVFAKLDPKAFHASFDALVGEIRDRIAGSRGAEVIEQIAVDGKVTRASRDTRKRLKALSVVSAWATAARLVLGQQAAEGKSNEKTAIPALLETLEIEGSEVSIDAAGTQIKNARTILEKGGDYVLALKANQPTLYLDVQAVFESVEEDASFDVPREVHETQERLRLSESAIRRVVNLRIKGAGIFWHREHAEAMLMLRSFYKAGRWNVLTRMAFSVPKAFAA